VTAPHIVRVMTWNIHGAVGRNPRFDLARVMSLIQRWSPDVVALQEVDSRRQLPNGGNPFTLLQDSLGKHGIGAKSITTTDGDYGQILISCCPILDSGVYDISWPEREPRRAIMAEIELPNGPLRLVATHLGLAIHERRNQANTLLEIAGSDPIPTVVLGDFNDWFWPGSVRKVLSREFPGRSRHRTFPSILPLMRLDRIYCRPPEALLRTFVDPVARHISDHLPVIGDIELAPTAVRGEGRRLATASALLSPARQTAMTATISSVLGWTTMSSSPTRIT
jgi:endonuclease/exonuclease/phosphatase family metal-dependent hydrolase